MRVQPTENQGHNNQDAFSRRRSPLPTALIAVNALLIGGCLALLIVSYMLRSQLDVYITVQAVAAADAILDFMDDLLALYVLCGSMLLLLFLGSLNIWAWKRTQSRFLRYGSIFLLLLAIAAIVAIWFRGATTGPIPMP
jgi:hypothetical protein